MAGRARPTLRVWHRKLLVAWGRDVTARVRTRPALVIAPHPDDETIGCGATIMQKTDAGTPVHVVIVGDGGADDRELREDECREACRRLGVADDAVEFLAFPDGHLEEHTDEIDARLCDAVARVAPADVFAPSAIDNHPDHRAVAAVVDRLRTGAVAAGSVGTADVYAYPVWYWNRWAWTTRSASPMQQRVDLAVGPARHTLLGHPRTVSAVGLEDRKRHALAAHESQVGAPDATSGGEVLDPKWLEMFFGPEELFFALQEPSTDR